MRFRPCIDLHEGKVKQIVGRSLNDQNADKVKVNFEAEKPSSWFAEKYRSDDLPGGHVIMLGPGNEEAALSALKAFPGGMHVGGGIKPDNAEKYLQAGASHVIVTSFVFRNGTIDEANLSRMEKAVGKDRLVLDLSCGKKDGEYLICTDRWQKYTDVVVNMQTLIALSHHCSEFLIHAVDVEGKQQGFDQDLFSILAEFSLIPVTYAGGIRSLDDLEQMNALGHGKIDATVGSALDIFGGPLSYDAVVKWQKNNKLFFSV